MTFYFFLDRINSLSVKPGKWQQEDKNEIKELASVLNWEVPNCNCGDRFNDVLIKLQLFIKGKEDFPKYSLRRGEIINYEGVNYSALTINDEVGAAYLKANPNDTKIILSDAVYSSFNETVVNATIDEAPVKKRRTKKVKE